MKPRKIARVEISTRVRRLFARLPASGLLAGAAALCLGATAEETAPHHSVWDGIFSAAQVARGKQAYNTLCARCHGETLGGGENSPPLASKDFLAKWNGKTVGELVEYTRTKMPSDGPGRLSRKQCTDLTAFLLSENDLPAGANDLAPDLAALNQIVITRSK